MTKHCSRAVRAVTMVEVMAATAVAGLLMTAGLSLAGQAASASSRVATTVVVQDNARRSLDEVLFQLRSAHRVVPGAVINGQTYTTGTSSVVVESPAYDPQRPDFFIPGVRDVVALRFDSATKMVTQTISRKTGSARPVRREMVIARNVTSLNFTYRVRESFEPTLLGIVNVNLASTPDGTPTVYVDGELVTPVLYANLNLIGVPVAKPGSDVQVLYSVSTTRPADLDNVVGVDMALRLAANDRRNVARSEMLYGTARLRNQRK